jgi:HlyD family secretion protein
MTNLRTSFDIAPISDGIVASTWLGLAAAFFLIGGFGVWAGTAQLAGAVLASGTVVVEGNVKKVQHPTGGVVGEIRVRDGDKSARAISWCGSTKL